MRTRSIWLTAVALLLPGVALGQTVPGPPVPDEETPPPFLVFAQGPGAFLPPPPGGLPAVGLGGSGGEPGRVHGRILGPGPGAWWKDSEVVKRLELSEAQVGQIEQTFLAQRLRLVDLRADLEKQELGLQPLLDADRPDESKVSAQLDRITAARGRLEKEHALMLLAIRLVLSPEQWKRLQALEHERRRGGLGGPPMGLPGSPGPVRGPQLGPPSPR